MNNKLTKEIQSENVFMTLGRLATAIEQIHGEPTKTKRAKLLLEKIANDVSQMDLDLPIEKRANF